MPPIKSKPKAKGKPKKPSLVKGRPVKTIDALSRRTITIKQDTEKAINALVGPRKFSAFAQAALDRELQRERIDHWLAEQEAARGGPLRPEAIEFAEKAWQSRK